MVHQMSHLVFTVPFNLREAVAGRVSKDDRFSRLHTKPQAKRILSLMMLSGITSYMAALISQKSPTQDVSETRSALCSDVFDIGCVRRRLVSLRTTTWSNVGTPFWSCTGMRPTMRLSGYWEILMLRYDIHLTTNAVNL